MARARPLRIVYCENNVDGTIGGSYYSLLYLVQGLGRRDYAPIVVFKREHRLMERFQAAADVLVWPPEPPATFAARQASPLLRALLSPLQKASNVSSRFVGAALARASFLRRRQVDLVHLNNSILANHEWMLGAMLAGVPCVTHERGINSRYGAFTRFLGRRLAAVICISAAVRDTLQQYAGLVDNLFVIHNGLDPATVAPSRDRETVRRHYGFADHEPVVCMMGNLRKWKGQETVIQALAAVRPHFPDVRLLLVGETSVADADYESRLKRLAAELGLTDHVVFTGYQSNVADLVVASDVVVHASLLPEPFGRVILDAMACHRPVIASRAGAIPEIVVENETGLTFPPGDAAALAVQLRRVLDDREFADRLARQGYARLIEHFHVRQNVDATERLYHRILDASA